jgi:hypothetical protein
MNAIDKLLDAVRWVPFEYESGEPKENLPFVTHQGVLNVLGIELKVCQLSNGMRVFEEGELEKLFGIAPQNNAENSETASNNRMAFASQISRSCLNCSDFATDDCVGNQGLTGCEQWRETSPC